MPLRPYQRGRGIAGWGVSAPYPATDAASDAPTAIQKLSCPVRDERLQPTQRTSRNCPGRFTSVHDLSRKLAARRLRLFRQLLQHGGYFGMAGRLGNLRRGDTVAGGPPGVAPGCQQLVDEFTIALECGDI